MCVHVCDSGKIMEREPNHVVGYSRLVILYSKSIYSYDMAQFSARFQSQRRCHQQIEFRKNLLPPHAFGSLLDPPLQGTLGPATELLWLGNAKDFKCQIHLNCFK